MSEDVAWAAGVFEGEGSICIRYTDLYQGSRCTLKIAMSDEDVVARVHEILGGRFNGPYYQKRKRKDGSEHLPRWEWAMSKRADVIATLELLIPYFGKRRRAKAEEAVAYLGGL